MIIFENEVGHVYINLVHVIWKRPIGQKFLPKTKA